MRRIALALLVVGLLIIATATAASAAPIVRTTHTHQVQTDIAFPCLGAPGPQDDAATVIYDTDETLHITAAGEDADGNPIPPFHVVIHRVETFYVVPDDPTLPTYTGHDIATFVNNTNQKTFGFSSEFNGKAYGSDGSSFRFNSNGHIQVNADGTVTVDNFTFTCSNER